MSAVRELTIALIKAGMDPVEATILIARAGMEMAPPADTRTAGARRQAAWRGRNKASQNVTDETVDKTSPNVSKRYETSQSNAASLSKKENIESKNSKREAAPRGSRLAEDWAPNAHDWQVAIEAIGPEPAKAELPKFRDHWKQQPGSKGVKLDWDAAWRNWIRRAAEYGGNRNGNRNINGQHRSASDSFLAGMRSLATDIVGDDPVPGHAREEIPLGRFNLDG